MKSFLNQDLTVALYFLKLVYYVKRRLNLVCKKCRHFLSKKDDIMLFSQSCGYKYYLVHSYCISLHSWNCTFLIKLIKLWQDALDMLKIINHIHYILLRSLVGLTDQAYPCCFYFRISWILMEQPWFKFFGSCGFL